MSLIHNVPQNTSRFPEFHNCRLENTCNPFLTFHFITFEQLTRHLLTCNWLSSSLSSTLIGWPIIDMCGVANAV